MMVKATKLVLKLKMIEDKRVKKRLGISLRFQDWGGEKKHTARPQDRLLI